VLDTLRDKRKFVRKNGLAVVENQTDYLVFEQWLIKGASMVTCPGL